MTPLISSFCKPIIALGLAGFGYIADVATPPIPGVPEWIGSLGLPVTFLLAVIYALVSTNKALRESEAGRRKDWSEFTAKLEAMMIKDSDSRERLIRATDIQTQQFVNLADQLKARPCQQTKP